MAQPTETSVPQGTANVDPAGFSAPSFTASKVICIECKKWMYEDGHRTYSVPCGWICKGCLEDKHADCKVCFPEEKEKCAQCGVETDYMCCANDDCCAWECRKCADAETHLCGTCKLELCPECIEMEVLTDRSFNPFWKGAKRCCDGCYEGTKKKYCSKCGDTFCPADDNTYDVCASCYDVVDEKEIAKKKIEVLKKDLEALEEIKKMFLQ